MNAKPVSDCNRMKSLKFSTDATIIFAEESKKIGYELAKSGDSHYNNYIVTNFYNRLSVLFKKEQEKENFPIACREGCSFCCRDNTVEVFLPEVLAIADFVNESFDEAHLEKVKNSLQQTVQKTKGSFGKGPYRVYRKCAFLQKNRCSIYEMRPANCRQFHSFDIKWCENKYMYPATDIPVAVYPDFKQKLHAAIAGFEDAYIQAGFEMKRYELNQLLYEVLIEPGIRENWLNSRI
jgi:Fe-S-cluster containining protein